MDYRVVKNGTPKTLMYDAVRVTNDGNLKVFGDFKARSNYNCPFSLFTLTGSVNLTGTGTETKLSTDIALPANTLGNNSVISFRAFISLTSPANSRYLVIRIGPNANNTDLIACYVNFGGNYAYQLIYDLYCLNSGTSKGVRYRGHQGLFLLRHY